MFSGESRAIWKETAARTKARRPETNPQLWQEMVSDLLACA